ncbi:hypothetical protein, partial [Chryseobacterium potabilaquae]
MKYYLIRPSLQKKDFGQSYPQAQDAIDNDRDSPNHIENNFGLKLDFEPLSCYPIINKKARVTDFIGSVVNSGNLQISSKLKSIIEKYTGEGIQYFRNTVLHNGQEYTDYWLLHPYQFDHEYIDFQNSMIKYKKKADDYETSRKTNMVFLSLNTLQEFEEYKEKARKKLETITIEKLFLKENVIKKDFFALRYVFGGMFYVS